MAGKWTPKDANPGVREQEMEKRLCHGLTQLVVLYDPRSCHELIRRCAHYPPVWGYWRLCSVERVEEFWILLRNVFPAYLAMQAANIVGRAGEGYHNPSLSRRSNEALLSGAATF